MVDIYIKESTKNPIKMTETKYTHPSFNKGEYVRLFNGSKQGLVFNKDNYLIGLWAL